MQFQKVTPYAARRLFARGVNILLYPLDKARKGFDYELSRDMNFDRECLAITNPEITGKALFDEILNYYAEDIGSRQVAFFVRKDS